MLSERDESEIAARILAAAGEARSIAPITDAFPEFGLADAYRVSAIVAEQRVARGERPVGWKIGFTNETIWDEYGVRAPIWGPMYDSTLAEVAPSATTVCRIGGLVEPRIEPEIAFRIAQTPDPGMDEEALFACVDAVAHGVELVQSLFPRWIFKAADTVAAFALHGIYRHGPFVTVGAGERAVWRERLAGFQVVLSCDGLEIDRGKAANVLGGGPVTALRHFVKGQAALGQVGLRIGDIVTTGTVTRAFPVKAGECWTTRIEGLPLPGLDLTFA